jgi:hypothetical protein
LLTAGSAFTPQVFATVWGGSNYTDGTGELVNAPGPAFGKIALGKWFHILLSCDASISSTINDAFTLATGPPMAIMVNAVDQWTSDKDARYSVAFPNTSVTVQLFPEQPTADNSFQGDAQSLQQPPTIVDGGGTVFGVTYGQVKLFVPGFEISWNGKSIALPGFFNPNRKVQYGPVQIWVGKSIDVRANISKFVTLSGDGTSGSPAPATAATSAFGTPTFEFRGGKSGFKNNIGTGGAFVASGTITDLAGPNFRH